MNPNDPIISFDAFFRSIARSVPGWKAMTKYTEDGGPGSKPRIAWFGYCLTGKNSLPIHVDMKDSPSATVRDLLTKMDQILKEEKNVRWAIVLPVARVPSHNSDDDCSDREILPKYLMAEMPSLKKRKSNVGIAVKVRQEKDL